MVRSPGIEYKTLSEEEVAERYFRIPTPQKSSDEEEDQDEEGMEVENKEEEDNSSPARSPSPDPEPLHHSERNKTTSFSINIPLIQPNKQSL